LLSMRSFAKFALILTALTTVAAVVAYRSRREKCTDMLSEVSDQGYETAHDILFPRNRRGGSKLHYGPVLPVD